MKRPSFLTSKADYSQLKTKLSGIVDVEKKLPDMVFKKQFECLYFIDFDWLYDAAILDVVRFLAVGAHEQEFVVWAPEQEKCYSDSFGYYPAIVLGTANPDDAKYTASIIYDPDPEGMSIRFQSNILILCGTSFEWAIWGDREFELAVIAVSKGIPAFSTGKFGHMQFADIEGALNLTSARFPNQIVPSEIAERFKKNYGSRNLFHRSES